jgi:hypothetical protein
MVVYCHNHLLIRPVEPEAGFSVFLQIIDFNPDTDLDLDNVNATLKYASLSLTRKWIVSDEINIHNTSF